MYKNFIAVIVLANMLFLTGGINAMKQSTGESAKAYEQEFPRVDRFMGIQKQAASGQRVVNYDVLIRDRKYTLSDRDYEFLLKIVQAEAGNQDIEGKMLVAGVVLNRVSSEAFPDTVEEVVLQKENGIYQFSPVANGSFYRAEATEETIEAVDKVLAGEDLTEGALYFASRKYADEEKMKWFDTHLTKLFEHGGHEFFTSG